MAEGQQTKASSGRVVGIVALCAVAAVAAIIGGTLLLSRHESTTVAGSVVKPRPGTPVLQLEVDTGSPLARAEKLLDHGKPAAAAAIFRQSSTPDAQLGLAFAEWTGPQSLDGVKAIVDANPSDPAMLLNLGYAYFQAGRNADAVSTWQETASKFPDSPYAIDALDRLNPNVVPGLPPIVVLPEAVPKKARPDLEAGVRAWDLRHVVTARRLLDAAAGLAPDSPEVLVADAVAKYSPTQPKAPFPTLGPLSGRFPRDSIVHLHLGLLNVWSREIARAKVQFRQAASLQPSSIYAKQARALLKALGHE